MRSRTLFLFAGICAFSVANIYYNQPLLVLFAQTFGTDVGQASSIAMTVQLAYAAGLVLFVPLGDWVSRRKLMISLLFINAASSIWAATSPSLPMLIAAHIAIGMTSVGAQIIIPAVSLMTSPEQRGRAVGTVMSGLLAGILLARTLSGLVGDYAGWRTMYVLAAAIDLGLIVVVAAALPAGGGLTRSSYGQLLRSLGQLLATERELRLACLCGALMFGAFSALWGALAYLLSRPPYHFHSDVVGLFGLVGIVGIFASPFIGRLSDRLGARTVVLLGAIAAACAFALIGSSALLLPALLLGIVILDLGGRAGLVGNQLRALSLSDSARSRLNTVFMACYFLGGALGTRAGAALAGEYGWSGIAALGLAASTVVIVLNANAIVALRGRGA
ncbi:MFS transporter [Chromobacterium paludis]|uniref:MFS transporter n=1 Tax=Chromobacterium paludis TaxID=2605945 RepID=A0A5C1DL68_9NEIS|nr:MFS transporter [Chromobacterium paludis]QEL57475.1 MFS transporter [Chromobacterium paludis]